MGFSASASPATSPATMRAWWTTPTASAEPGLRAGSAYVGFVDDQSPALDLHAPELMLRHADDVLGQDLDAIVAGPGLGTSERAETLVAAVIASDIPCVLDADALNLI